MTYIMFPVSKSYFRMFKGLMQALKNPDETSKRLLQVDSLWTRIRSGANGLCVSPVYPLI